MKVRRRVGIELKAEELKAALLREKDEDGARRSRLDDCGALGLDHVPHPVLSQRASLFRFREMPAFGPPVEETGLKGIIARGGERTRDCALAGPSRGPEPVVNQCCVDGP